MEFLDQMVFWHWWVVAIILIVIEVMSGTLFFMFIALAAVIVGFLSLAAPVLSWTGEFILFSVLSLVCIVGWHYYRKARPVDKTDQPALNRRGSQYLGRVFTLEEPIINGAGKIKVDDTNWKIESSEDLKTGDKVKVTQVEGTILRVIKA